MIFDHREIAEKALDTLRLLLDVKVPQSNLLPETFTMNELQQLYESILGKPLFALEFPAQNAEHGHSGKARQKVWRWSAQSALPLPVSRTITSVHVTVSNKKNRPLGRRKSLSGSQLSDFFKDLD